MHKGLGERSASFFSQLEQHNDRDWWADHRSVYDQDLRPTFVALVESIDGLGPWRTYRPNNDARFGNTAPYKTFLGAVTERSDGVGVFVQLGPRGLLVGTGMPMPAPDQLAALRSAIAHEDSGAAFIDAVEQVRATGATVHGGRYESLKRVPRGFERDHPRADHLRWKGVEASSRAGTPRWLDTGRAPDELAELIAASAPIDEWLGINVGPSALSPEERFAPKRR